MTTCTPFTSKIPLNEHAVYVSCTDEENLNIYKNIHMAITINAKVQKKISKQNRCCNKKPFSVLFVGLDSVSRLSLQRIFPKTREFLQKNNWVEFTAYNKVGLNTFPNVMAILTGRNESDAFNECDPRVAGGLDKCNLLWYIYRNLDYITAYAEDEANMDTFNYLKKGFVTNPTDYYFRSYLMATEQDLNTFQIDGLQYCTGPESAGERVLNLCKEFVTTFLNHSYFGFFWMNSFTHNSLNGGSRMDTNLLNFFVELNKIRSFENTFVIFLSDHGFRFGEYIYTHSGWVEERLPFLYIHVPHRFRKDFRVQYLNLLKNANKLTSPFDLYMTLQEILVYSGKPHVVELSNSCPSCRSFFQKIESSRSCTEAGVDPQWCSCNTYFTIPPNNVLVEETVRYIINEVHNTIVNAGGDFEQCERYSQPKVMSAKLSEHLKNLTFLLVTFSVEPTAVFQGTVSIDTFKERPTFKLVGSVGRMDYYGDHSWCTFDSTIKRYCYCKSEAKQVKRLVHLVGKGISKVFSGF